MGQNPWYLGTNSKIDGKWMFNCFENGPRSIDRFPNLLVAFNPFKERENTAGDPPRPPRGCVHASMEASGVRWGSSTNPKKTRFISKKCSEAVEI